MNRGKYEVLYRCIKQYYVLDSNVLATSAGFNDDIMCWLKFGDILPIDRDQFKFKNFNIEPHGQKIKIVFF